MAKTLTDRTSVRVTAKSDTDANNQKKNDANNIAKALGKDGDLDDSKASSVASKLGNTITDENGTTWAKSSEVAAAAKELDGEIEETPEWDEYVHNGMVVYRCNNISYHINDRLYYPQGHPGYHYLDDLVTITGDLFTTVECDETNWDGTIYHDGKIFGSFGTASSEGTYTENRIYTYIDPNDEYYGQSYNHSGYPSISSPGAISSYGGIGGHGLSPNLYGRDNVPTLTRTLIDSLLNEQPVAHHGGGGSKIDTSKSEDQIKDELESKAWKQGKAAKINPVEPNETYIAVTDANGNPLYFLGT